MSINRHLERRSKMTEKQKLFAENYLANGFNARDAYYSAFGENGNKQPSYPYTLLKNKEISGYI
jgi:phage terminase small subunit